MLENKLSCIGGNFLKNIKIVNLVSLVVKKSLKLFEIV